MINNKYTVYLIYKMVQTCTRSSACSANLNIYWLITFWTHFLCIFYVSFSLLGNYLLRIPVFAFSLSCLPPALLFVYSTFRKHAWTLGDPALPPSELNPLVSLETLPYQPPKALVTETAAVAKTVKVQLLCTVTENSYYGKEATCPHTERVR